ncbi:protein asteroid isoform X2 [Cardiocondyla obscurior]
MKTIMSRVKQKIEIASNYTFSTQERTKFFPLSLTKVFIDVMNELEIKHARCVFEADNTIAAVARSLNCPVLSYDSDFYIYGSLYIPFNTFENNIMPNPSGNGFVKHCRIYSIDKLFKTYYGLNQTSLFLAAVLLGNDYVKQRTFKKFFNHLPQIRKRYSTEQHRKIDGILHWLRRRTLNEAIIGILSRLRKEERKNILNKIEMIMNSYVDAPLSVLKILGFSAEVCFKASMDNVSKKFKFEGDIYNLTYEEDEPTEAEQSDEEEKKDEEEAASILEDKQLVSNESLVNNLPAWFITEFQQNRYPSYFLDVIIRKLYISRAQLEDPTSVSTLFVALKIISVIYAILISVNKSKPSLEYVTRDMNRGIQRYQLEYCDNILGCKLPCLLNLREIPFVVRKEILNSTLGIYNARDINEFPSNWMLYLATIKYWIDQHEEPSKLRCHIYALLFAMLFNIIDCNIGTQFRVLAKFHQKCNKIVEDIQRDRQTKKYQPQYPVDTTLTAAVYAVNVDDCFLASRFFISNFEIDRKLYSQPKKYDISIIHNFAEFQNCVIHTDHLNSLLNYPYEPTKLSAVYNGTLLYNLCSNFKKRDNVEAYINLILQNSASLLHLFNTLLTKAKPLLKTALQIKTDENKKQKVKKHKKKEHVINEEKEKEETCEDSDEQEFYDTSNSFSVLGLQS